MLIGAIALALTAPAPALTTVHSNAFGENVAVAAHPLPFAHAKAKTDVTAADRKNNPFLAKLRSSYHLDRIVAGPGGDLERLHRLTAWVHSRWAHNGSNEPSKGDALTILTEAKLGKEFRCVEYSEVLAAAANAVGIPARVLNIKTEDVETRAGGAGHVVVEAFLPDRRKWVMADGQFGIMPMLGKTPLNAVEFQAALARKNPRLNLGPDPQTSLADYADFVRPYLYYFDAKLKAHYDPDGMVRSAGVMLVPLGAKEPTGDV